MVGNDVRWARARHLSARHPAARYLLAVVMSAPPNGVTALDAPQENDVIRIVTIAAGAGIIAVTLGIGIIRWTQGRRRRRLKRWVR